MKNIKITFYRSLFKAIAMPLISTVSITLVYIVVMSSINHNNTLFGYCILFFALIKTYIIALVTFKHLSKLVKECYSFERLFAVFGLLIIITILSFATDYSCLFEYQQSAFSGLSNHSFSYLKEVPDFIYFSITTFATVGYGDIIPVSSIAKILVTLEIFLSFLIIVFALANINKIHIKK
jgi:hypothetical protein